MKKIVWLLIICFFSQVALVAKAEVASEEQPKVVEKQVTRENALRISVDDKVVKTAKVIGRSVVLYTFFRYGEGIIKWSGKVAFALIHNNANVLNPRW